MDKDESAPKKDDGAVTINKDTLYGVIIAVLACLLVVSAFTQGFGLVKQACPNVTGQCPTPGQNGTTTPPALPALTVATGDLPALGQASAPVSIVLFSDYQCPYCSRIYLDGEAGMRTNYVDTGKAKMYFRDFPLSFHPNAMPAAIAARCAAAQGKFWEMHDKLFSNQASWSSSTDVKTVFSGYAAELGLNAATFTTCYDAQTPAAAITADQSAGASYGVGGTPAVFLILPKSKVSATAVTAAVAAVNAQFGGDAVTLYENQDQYIAFIAGAYPYSAFDGVLSKVSY